MTWASPKGSISMNQYPKTVSWIAVSVGGLAMFLLFASWVLVSFPIGSTVRGYFYGVDSLQKLEFSSSLGNQNLVDSPLPNNVVMSDKDAVSESSSDKNVGSDSNSEVPTSSNSPLVGSEAKDLPDEPVVNESIVSVKPVDQPVPSGSSSSSVDENVETTPQTLSNDTNSQVSFSTTHNESEDVAKPALRSSNVTEISVGPEQNDTTTSSSDSKSGSNPASSDLSNDASTGSVDTGCDLYHGSWFYDSSGPQYTNNTCPVLTQMQNCQGNGRPDKEYENWRWKPLQCDLPRFDARKFLELMRGKTIAFIGDSVARNHMESLLCILWQVEAPKNRGNKKMQRYYFKSTNTFVVRIWSSWLVKQTSEAFDFAPEGVAKLHLDAPDDRLMDVIPQFDVIIFSSGHWFAKQSVYILNNEIVGGQLWWPDKSKQMKINNIEAFGISVETILTALATHPNYTGIAIVRSYSPDHYEGGAWNTGGSCTGKVRPLAPGQRVENGFTNIMHEKQVMGFNRAIKKLTNKSKLELMDITEAFEYRHDGHPGPYRSPDPNKQTKRGPDGKPPPQDCLHWCMPGPVDTWNEFVLEIIRREYEGSKNLSS
ncbi:protein trichome birefringence-like 18 isoform X1 [Rosa rugosa]|uniref:protein trichome birefringence-like 18 isoform X1 n=1 Tax=Rosa rugosa TaxID=74645 RepID=UPI002B41218A|nr:protein trichome birefringence-like 18 isoform X1 [Rosa rugosa]